MARVKRGVAAHARHKKVLKLAKGYRGRAKAAFRVGIEKVEKGLQYAYRDRRNKKRDFRSLWIARINAAVNAEDRWLCERVQRGLESPQYRPGPLSGLETWMFEFHDLLERAIPEIRADAPPAQFA